MHFETNEDSQPSNELQSRIDDLYNLVGNSEVRNNFLSEHIALFLRKLKKQYPDVDFKNVPVLEKLRGGSEVSDEIDKELLREIESEAKNFIDRLEIMLQKL